MKQRIDLAAQPVEPDDLVRLRDGLLDVAFPGDFSATGRAIVLHVADSGEVRADEALLEGTTLSQGAIVAVVGTTSSRCRPGGGVDVGKDGKIYVGVGDMDEPSGAQNDGSLAARSCG